MDQPAQDGASERVAVEGPPALDPDTSTRPRRERRSAHVDGDRWRRDIQGLRGVAILAVVIYHADPALLPGGFMGVDLFFVISGFLITGLLMRELEERGTISLRRFYARRIRRLLPMAFIVIAATVIAADLLQSPLDATRTAKDALSSALFVANYRFALEQTNYLYAGVGLSPFQHFWSLGVEEQMYAIWPVLLLGGAKMWQRGRTYTRGAFGILFVGSVVSFLACLRLTNSNEPWAFFSFPTRAWELGVGGLIALAAPSLRTLPRGVSWLLGLGGMGAVAWAAVSFGASTPWPGDASAVPVLGAAAIIAAGCSKVVPLPARLLAFPGLQFAGRISYPWYLWHWPVLVLAPLVLKHSLDPAQALLLVGASGALATVSHFLVERPVHVSTWLAQRSRRGLTLGFGLTAGAIALCTSSVAALALPSVSVIPPSLGHPHVAAAQSAAPTNPEVAELASSTAEVQADLATSQAIQTVPGDVTPSLAGAFGDIPILYNDGCVDTYTSITLNPCVYGDTKSSTSVVLFGDSHAAMWFPAIDQAAERYSWKLYAWAKDTCPPLVLPVISPDLGRAYTECTSWRNEVLQEIAEIHPALVILGVARHYSPIYGFTVYSSQWLSGLAEMVTQIRALGSRVLVMGPIPKPRFTVASCLSENLSAAENCASPRDSSVDIPGMRDEEEASVVAAGGSYVNTLFWFCTTESTCPPIVDGVLVYRDDNHITATYASFLTTPVEAAVDLAEQGIPDPLSAVYLGPNSS